MLTPKKLLLMSGGATYPTTSLNFMSGVMDPRITFTRASAAWYMDSSGLLAQAATDVPRFDYDFTVPGQTTLKGFLCEGPNTNEALWSRDLTNVAWTKTNTTAALDQTGIDGSANSASSLTASAGNGTCTQSITSTSSARILSCYIKRITGSGTINMTMDNGGTWTAVTVTSSWTRVAVPSATLTNPIIGFRIVTNGDKIAVDVVQEERRATQSSPIVTTSAQVTRSGDSPVMTGSNFTDWFNFTQGTFRAKFIIPYATVTGVDSYIYDADNNSLTEKIGFRVNGGGLTTSAQNTSANTNTALISAGSISLGALQNAVFGYKLDDFGASLNNAATQTDSAGAVAIPDRFWVGRRFDNGSQIYGWVQSIDYWNLKFPNTTIQTLSK